MQARITNPAIVIPGAMQALQGLSSLLQKSGVPAKTLGLVELRASQINGCSVCLDMHAHLAKQAGETDERLWALAGWRDAPFFTDAERAALALTEAATRLADRSDPVPDEIWNEAAAHYDERGLADLVLAIGVINVWNRLNVTTRQVADEWRKSPETKRWIEEHAAR